MPGDNPIPNTPFGQYFGELLLKPNPDGLRMTSVKAFGFLDSRNKRWPVPAGAVVDGASIPQINREHTDTTLMRIAKAGFPPPAVHSATLGSGSCPYGMPAGTDARREPEASQSNK